MNKFNSFAKKHHWLWAAIGSLLMFLTMSLISGKISFSSFSANFTIACYVTLCALGQMIVMTTGRGAFDLSIPNMITLSAFLTMGLINGENGKFFPVLLLVIAVGALIGFINSLLVIRLKITPMIATLAVGYILSTMTSIYNRTFNCMEVCGIMQAVIGKKILGLPIICYLVLLIVAGIYGMFRSVTLGRALLALGQNKKAAQLAGIKVNLVETFAYMISAVLAALCGFFLSGRVGGAFLGMGDSYLMDTVGSVVIGGTLASGGRAVAVGTLFGALFLGFVVAAMQVANFSIGVQNIIKGIIIVLVLALSSSRKGKTD
ncbi:ABC transporter permease [Clostridium sp. AM58-1XD]|uniref:ABC transporter permease n=1 Tax=Clostridium sp. AM58-1XD TaxID=2292307 RepID=UPI000E4832C2|nr:ABC transporter permease [Clostridium sp. AM58-1XD]RGY99260.1 ABC transporter permease [Clostridium sp. AM58-1XD]